MIYFSIIIPHKNSIGLLQYCLSSIPVRDDIQVIVVDDNSDPNKVDFMNFPKWKGGCYECYFTKEGKGAGYARNVGLEHAKGKWVLFVDADDFLVADADDIFESTIGVDADIVFYRPKSVMLHDRTIPSLRASNYNRIIDNYLLCDDETELRVRFFSPTCKFVRRSLIQSKNIRFEEIQYSNDNLFAVSIGCNANNIKVCDREFYVITESNDSLVSNYCSKPNELQIRSEAFLRVSNYIQKFNFPIDKNVAFDFLSRMLVTNKKLYVSFFQQIMLLLNYSRIKLILEEFRGNKPWSRVKRTIYAFLITLH